MVDIYLVVIERLDVSRLSVYGGEIHIEEIGGTVDIYCPRRDHVWLIVDCLLIIISCRGDDEEDFPCSYALFYGCDKASYSIVKFLIYFLGARYRCHCSCILDVQEVRGLVIAEMF